jgi:hypothetical protein
MDHQNEVKVSNIFLKLSLHMAYFILKIVYFLFLLKYFPN